MDIQSLDLNKLETSASYYLEHSSRGLTQDSSIPRSVMDGILPVLEVISSGKSSELFKAALDKRKLCLAALCVSPPEIGISLAPRIPGSLVANYDASHAGKAFRRICIGISKCDYPLVVADILAEEISANGIEYEENTLVKNGLYELARTISVALISSHKPTVEHRFVSKLHALNQPEDVENYRVLLSEMQKEIFSAYINDGKVSQVKEFFDFIDELSGGHESRQLSSVELFDHVLRQEFTSPTADDVIRVTNLILTVDHPSLDKYRSKAIVFSDQSLQDSDYLKAALKLVSKMTVSNEWEMGKLAEIYNEAGSAVLSDGIRDREDYLALSALPGLKMAEIDITKIPKQARGAALEHDLGL